jgi:hypothetical protein
VAANFAELEKVSVMTISKSQSQKQRHKDARRGTSDHMIRDDGSELTPDEIEFGMAVEQWRVDNRNPDGSYRFPSCSDLLGIAKKLGYRKEKKI